MSHDLGKQAAISIVLIVFCFVVSLGTYLWENGWLFIFLKIAGIFIALIFGCATIMALIDKCRQYKKDKVEISANSAAKSVAVGYKKNKVVVSSLVVSIVLWFLSNRIDDGVMVIIQRIISLWR